MLASLLYALKLFQKLLSGTAPERADLGMQKWRSHACSSVPARFMMTDSAGRSCPTRSQIGQTVTAKGVAHVRQLQARQNSGVHQQL